jgi:hypothetical protein
MIPGTRTRNKGFGTQDKGRKVDAIKQRRHYAPPTRTGYKSTRPEERPVKDSDEQLIKTQILLAEAAIRQTTNMALPPLLGTAIVPPHGGRSKSTPTQMRSACNCRSWA